MKIHKNLVEAVVEGLFQIFEEGFYADKVIEKLLKKDKRWGSRDRAFIAETIYEIVRWKRLLQEATETKDFTTNSLLKIIATWFISKEIEIPSWFDNSLNINHIKRNLQDLNEIRKFRESIPDWLDELGEKELGKAIWEQEIKALNTQASVIIRVNLLKISKENLKKELESENISTETIKGFPDALLLKNRVNIFATKSFQKGFFEVQDASSQKIAYMLDLQPNMRVIDCCAGAGGKTLHLASLMENKGKILACDIHQYKLDELKKRAKRNGAFNIETKLIDYQLVKRNLHAFDRVLIDAPCSGLGVLRRNPDAKWKIQPDFLQEIQKTQQKILSEYSKMLKNNGKLVYATCSILPSENRKQIETFLASEKGKSFFLEKDENIFAHQSGFDGFYYAVLSKKQ